MSSWNTLRDTVFTCLTSNSKGTGMSQIGGLDIIASNKHNQYSQRVESHCFSVFPVTSLNTDPPHFQFPGLFLPLSPWWQTVYSRWKDPGLSSEVCWVAVTWPLSGLSQRGKLLPSSVARLVSGVLPKARNIFILLQHEQERTWSN